MGWVGEGGGRNLQYIELLDKRSMDSPSSPQIPHHPHRFSYLCREEHAEDRPALFQVPEQADIGDERGSQDGPEGDGGVDEDDGGDEEGGAGPSNPKKRRSDGNAVVNQRLLVNPPPPPLHLHSTSRHVGCRVIPDLVAAIPGPP